MELDRVPPTLWCPSLSRQLQQLAEPGLGHRTCTAVVLTIAKHQVEGVDAPGIAEPSPGPSGPQRQQASPGPSRPVPTPAQLAAMLSTVLPAILSSAGYDPDSSASLVASTFTSAPPAMKPGKKGATPIAPRARERALALAGPRTVT